jgi:hypothetical protein
LPAQHYEYAEWRLTRVCLDYHVEVADFSTRCRTRSFAPKSMCASPRAPSRCSIAASVSPIGAMNYRSVASIRANNLDRAAARPNRNEPTLFEHPNVH